MKALRKDPNLKILANQIGMPSAYAFYSMMIEVLQELPENKLSYHDMTWFAAELGVSEDMAKQLVAASVRCSLLQQRGIMVFSEKLNAHLAVKDPARKMDLPKIRETFEIFRKQYPGTKNGFEVEFKNFRKKYSPTLDRDVEELLPALIRENEVRVMRSSRGEFMPPYKNLSTWINQHCWTTEWPEFNNAQVSRSELQYVPSGPAKVIMPEV